MRRRQRYEGAPQNALHDLTWSVVHAEPSTQSTTVMDGDVSTDRHRLESVELAGRCLGQVFDARPALRSEAKLWVESPQCPGAARVGHHQFGRVLAHRSDKARGLPKEPLAIAGIPQRRTAALSADSVTGPQ